MTTQEIIKLIAACHMVITTQDANLTALGKGLNLSVVPGYEGWEFDKYLIEAVKRI